MSPFLVRRIRDNLHGSIDISELEDAVIAHPFFQRLRRVRQLAFLHYVFPGATHTRFEHSLGVMHLASLAWAKLKANQARLKYSLARYQDFAATEPRGKNSQGRLAPSFALAEAVFDSDYVLQCFRLAALLHDVGHPAFSHSGELFMPRWSEVEASNTDLPEYLKSYIHQQIQELKNKGQDPAAVKVRHEIYSILLIEAMMRDIYKDSDATFHKIDARDIISIINPRIPPAQNSPLLEVGAYPLLRELISGELDIDRMDYLLRDSRECGVVYGVFDVDRILDSLCVYFDDTDQQLHVAIMLSGLAAFEDYLRARYSMYLQLYFHKSSVAAEAMMRHLTQGLAAWRLPAKAQISLDAIQTVQDILQKHAIRHQMISSANSLTRFQPRDAGKRSRNYLRLIRKDEQQRPRVSAIEDYSNLIASNDSVAIHRIYAMPSAGHSIASIKALISEALKSKSKDS
ncbi:MAG: HD domain-containing protein [Proteobacteria bacterium]|nr:HD domain-containing protein [Pseudomonadota bacterium]